MGGGVGDVPWTGRSIMTATARSSVVGAPAYTQVFRREAESADRARQMVWTALDAWHLRQIADEALLVVSELIANSVQHARGSVVRITVTRISEYRVRLACIDKSRKKPVLAKVTLADERGRGMAIIAAVSEQWGANWLLKGKRVWAELEVDQ